MALLLRSKDAYIYSSHSASQPHLTRSIRDEVAQRVKYLKSRYPRFAPQLTIIQAGDRPDSTVYVRMKSKAAEEVGIKYNHVGLPAAASVEDVVRVVKRLNDDESVSGILVQLPLGPHVDPEGERTVTEAISPEKDVDGYVVCILSSTWQLLIDIPVFMRTISDIWPLARPIRCSRLAPLLVSSILSSLQECRSPVPVLLYSGAQISWGVLLPRC
jgi:Tetrahydrofolate dehydrogenase/cyclohydrolase, catalytic domain